MGRYAKMTPEQYHADIRKRLGKRAKLLAGQYKERSSIGGDYETAQRALARNPDFSERRLSDEWTGAGRTDPMFILQYQNKLRSVVAQDLSGNRYWKFVSSWLNDRRRFGGRSELDQVLWVKLLVPQYDLPFIRSTVFGTMMTQTELDDFRYLMRIEPFLIGRRLGYDSKPLTPEDITRVMTEFDAMKMERPDVVADTQEDMMRFAEWLASPLSSDLTGPKAVERALEPIRNIGGTPRPTPKPLPKICPDGHENPPNAKFCGFCDEPYRFPTLPTCSGCRTVAISEAQKRCHECGAPFDGGESPIPGSGLALPNLQQVSGNTAHVYDGVDPFVETLAAAPQVPTVSTGLRQKWGRNLCDVEPDEVLISSVAIHFGFPHGTIEQQLYLPESREAYDCLMRHLNRLATR
jgi:hypothetical protein